MGRLEDGEIGISGDWEVGRLGDGETERLGRLIWRLYLRFYIFTKYINFRPKKKKMFSMNFFMCFAVNCLIVSFENNYSPIIAFPIVWVLTVATVVYCALGMRKCMMTVNNNIMAVISKSITLLFSFIELHFVLAIMFLILALVLLFFSSKGVSKLVNFALLIDIDSSSGANVVMDLFKSIRFSSSSLASLLGVILGALRFFKFSSQLSFQR